MEYRAGERKGWNSSEFHSLTVAQHPGIWGICLFCLVQIAHWPRLPVPGGPVGFPLFPSDLWLSHPGTLVSGYKLVNNLRAFILRLW